MKRLRYTVLPSVGPGEIPAEGTVVDLLFALPYFLGFGWPFPSHAQLNSLLRKGYDDAGMSGGCEWEPFELSREEYAEVRQALAHDQRLARLPVPSLEGSDERVRDIKNGYWAWDPDKGGWVSNDDLPPRLEDIEDIPF
jgi:hypothetical protein